MILGLDLDSGLSPRAHVVPEKRLETWLPSGVKVSVWKGDLVDFQASAVVNAANSRLSHFGGLALALSQAGGAQVQRESDDYVRNHGEVKTGDAVALTGGKLKCDVIIHAVGPRLTFKPNAHQVSAAKPFLERAVRRVLEIVEERQVETVAIPALSSGIFNFPVDECADVIVTTLKRFYSSISSHRFKPKEVLLVNNDDPTVKEMEWACLRLLPQPGPVLSSQTTASGSKPSTSRSVLYSQAAAGGKPHTSASGAQTRSKTAPHEVQLGPVRVLLKKGFLEEQKVGVIVNTISADKNLSHGQVSKTLLKKAGYKMQQEIYSVPVRGSVYITKGHGLDCKEVYHICCALKSMLGSDMLLFRSVQESLWFAVGSKHSSIAFPAIGTGNLGFPDHEAAKIMFNAVWNFAQSSPLPLEVHFVIFPSDSERYKAFEVELNGFRPKTFQTEPPQGLVESPITPTEPCISLHSSSEQSRGEAETWLRALLDLQFNTVCISNNFTQHLGEKELDELCQTEVEGVVVEEFLEKGRAGLVVSGDRAGDIVVTALKLQEMLQSAQTQFLKEEVEELKREAQMKVKVEMERSPVSNRDPQIKTFIKDLRGLGLQIVKAERVENRALEKVFHLKKAQMSSHSSWDLLQLVPAQFCDLVGHVGFRPECAPPDDSCLGEGLYFAADVQTALNLWTERLEQFLYLFVAEVLKGKSGRGKPDLVLAPGLDSVEESGVTVIFDHRQSLPRFILTCCKDSLNSPV